MARGPNGDLRKEDPAGMDAPITRRDFLNGMALTIGTVLIPSQWAASHVDSPELSAGFYPPALTGLRGSNDGSYEAAHRLRDGTLLENASIQDTGEEYDLVVVGGGISGLSAAYFYRKSKGCDARILILDNHDDFGGHARRNEFHLDRRMILGFGGNWSIDSPAPYSSVARRLIRELGIDVERWSKVVDRKLYPSLGMHSTVFFDRKTFGVDRLVPFFSDIQEEGEDREAEIWKRFLAEAPLTDAAKADFQRLFNEPGEYMPGLSSADKKAKLARISYAAFLTDFVKVDPQIVKLYQARTHGLYGVGIDAVPAQDAWGLEFPGFEGMKLDSAFGRGMNLDAMLHPDGGESYFFHFPDGNATIARILVRHLIPAAIPGKTAEDIITARCDYSNLDRSSSTTRIRLDSTVVQVRHKGPPSGSERVEIVYMKANKLKRVRAKHCVLACWHSMIPYICPDLPDAQKEALLYGTKVPLLYTNIVVSNWKAFVRAGTHHIYCPGSYHSTVQLDMPVSIGDYRCPKNPEEPIMVHLVRTPCSPGLSARSQHRTGRVELLNTTFETYEKEIREQLDRMLGPYGLDAARDIRAITVNRWAHGYAYQYNSLFDPFWLEGKETPCEHARQPFGRVAIANADSGAYSYTDCAIDHAHRAVTEVLSVK